MPLTEDSGAGRAYIVTLRREQVATMDVVATSGSAAAEESLTRVRAGEAMAWAPSDVVAVAGVEPVGGGET